MKVLNVVLQSVDGLDLHLSHYFTETVCLAPLNLELGVQTVPELLRLPRPDVHSAGACHTGHHLHRSVGTHRVVKTGLEFLHDGESLLPEGQLLLTLLQLDLSERGGGWAAPQGELH